MREECLKEKDSLVGWGGEKVTVRNLEVVGVNVERDLLLLKGAVPGPAGSQVVIVRRTTK